MLQRNKNERKGTSTILCRTRNEDSCQTQQIRSICLSNMPQRLLKLSTLRLSQFSHYTENKEGQTDSNLMKTIRIILNKNRVKNQPLMKNRNIRRKIQHPQKNLVQLKEKKLLRLMPLRQRKTMRRNIFMNSQHQNYNYLQPQIQT